MAITKTLFSGTTSEANAAEIYTWMQANANEYFDSITCENNRITCSTSGGGYITIKSGIREWECKLDNGKSFYIDNYMNDTSKVRISAAYKTSKGIALVISDEGWIFVCKSNSGSTGVLLSSYYHPGRYAFADLAYSTKWIYDVGYDLTHIQMAMTSLAPVPLGDSGTYADGLYFVPFYQYDNMGMISVGGKSYVYSGWAALEE